MIPLFGRLEWLDGLSEISLIWGENKEAQNEKYTKEKKYYFKVNVKIGFNKLDQSEERE